MCCAGAAADTLEWALVQAYQNNPSLNAQRASLRSTDENVPQALSGYRPKLTVTANGVNYTTQTIANMDAIVALDFKNEQPVVITKTIASTVTKGAPRATRWPAAIWMATMVPGNGVSSEPSSTPALTCKASSVRVKRKLTCRPFRNRCSV